VNLRSLDIILANIIHDNRLAVERVDLFGYSLAMPRPRKAKGERKDADLRIPLTAAQKELIVEAARLEGVDMAAWGRPILLRAAQERIAEGGSAKATREKGSS
jgi:hypothetical protein